jgi:hypothetical protein
VVQQVSIDGDDRHCTGSLRQQPVAKLGRYGGEAQMASDAELRQRGACAEVSAQERRVLIEFSGMTTSILDQDNLVHGYLLTG